MNQPNPNLLPGDEIPAEHDSLLSDLQQALHDAGIAHAEAGRRYAERHHQLFDYIRGKYADTNGWDFVVGASPQRIRLVRNHKEDAAAAEAEFAEMRAKTKALRAKMDAQQHESPEKKE